MATTIKLKVTGIPEKPSTKRIDTWYVSVTVDEEFKDIEVENFLIELTGNATNTITKEEQADDYIADNDLMRDIMDKNYIFMVENWEVLSMSTNKSNKEAHKTIKRISNKEVSLMRKEKDEKEFAYLLEDLKGDNLNEQFAIDMYAIYTTMRETIKDLGIQKQFEICLQSLSNSYTASSVILQRLNEHGEKIKKMTLTELNEYRENKKQITE